MSGSDDFTPRLGRPRDRGGAYGTKLRKAVGKQAKRGVKRAFSGAQIGRGSAAGRAASFRRHPFAVFRMRRVVVKTHIARAAKGIGQAAFRAHLKYIQRDGVERDGPDGERRGGNLYGRDADKLDDSDFLERSEGDRHQFRVILSPEDADQLGDLKTNTRVFMAQMEKDLGTPLDWVAVDHHNTGHPHTHIVIRGKDRFGKDLIIARDYLTQGMRRRAQEIVTETLGPRRDMEIARSQQSEVAKDRLTSIDRDLAKLETDGRVTIGSATGAQDRFQRSLHLSRLKHLEGLKLAARDGRTQWRMAEDWQDCLREMGRRGDIIRSLSRAAGRDASKEAAAFDPASETQKTVLGRVISDGAGDELRDTRFLAVEGADGRLWHVPVASQMPGTLPPRGAIVEVAPSKGRPKPSDRTIAAIAAAHGRRYSDAIHAEDDPSSSASYREAHKRRLEALRRRGLVEHLPDGSFAIPDDYLERVGKLEAGTAKVTVQSWVSLDGQVEARALAWIDTAKEDGHGAFGIALDTARQQRAAFLEREGLVHPENMTPDERRRLGEAAKTAAAKRFAAGRAYVPTAEGERFEGIYEKPVDLAQGRFAIIAKSKEFTLVPWRPELERSRGKLISVKQTGKGIAWTLGKARGISR